MLALALGSLVLAALMSFLIGRSVIAERDSFLRTKFGVSLLVAGALSFVLLPPQLTSMDAALAPISGQLGSLGSGSAWPAALDKGFYLVVWAISSLGGLLVGMRVWNAGKPGWRPGGTSNADDTSPAGRARGLLPMSDSLDDALDTLRRTGVDARGASALAEELRAVGRRFAPELAKDPGALYRQVVAVLPSGGLAPVVTRLLLEGVGRGGEVASLGTRR